VEIWFCGVLDFQDAGFGSQAYDLMSLLQDIRIEVGDAFEQEMRAYYLSRQPANFDREGFFLSYFLLGLQRAGKILGILLRRAQKYLKQKSWLIFPVCGTRSIKA
jgi:aminoglycoside/choline kinase family phosphotransferase